MIQNSRTFNWNPIGTYCIMSTQRQAVLCSNPIFEIRGGQNLKKQRAQLLLESDSGVIFCKSAAEPRADNVVRGAARAIPEPIPGEWHYNPQLHKPWPGASFPW